MLGLGAMVIIIIVGISLYFQIDANQKAKAETTRLATAAAEDAKRPVCTGKDPAQSWLETRGNCRLPAQSIAAQSEDRKLCMVDGPFDPDAYLACSVRVEKIRHCNTSPFNDKKYKACMGTEETTGDPDMDLAFAAQPSGKKT